MSENNGFGINRVGFGIGSNSGGGGGSASVYYNREWLEQGTSYRNHDERWRRDNPLSPQSAGGNTYNEAIPEAHYLQSVAPDLSNNRYDYLKFYNIHGHKFRFTGVNGGYYDEADGNYYNVNGVLSDKTTEFPPVSGAYWWVIDHLTGYKWPNNNLEFKNWNDTLDAAATTTIYYGAQDWVVPTRKEARQLTVGFQSPSTGSLATTRPFMQTTYQNSFVGSTYTVTTSNAFAFQHNVGNTPFLAKTSTASKTWYFILELTGTIPQP